MTPSPGHFGPIQRLNLFGFGQAGNLENFNQNPVPQDLNWPDWLDAQGGPEEEAGENNWQLGNNWDQHVQPELIDLNDQWVQEMHIDDPQGTNHAEVIIDPPWSSQPRPW